MRTLKYGAWSKNLLVIFIIANSCTVPKPIKGFDSQLWKDDQAGCKGSRYLMAGILLTSKDKLLGRSEESIMKILGKPDRDELYVRNQKFYIYYLDPGPSCGKQLNPDTSMLILRISALGKCSEVFSEKGFSTR